MSYILAERGGQYLLAAFAPHLRGCNLSTIAKPRFDANKYHLWQNRIWVWSHAQPEDIRFFPILRYRGCKVRPYKWHETSKEPILMVHMEDFELNLDTYFVKPPKNDTDEIMRAMRADGWGWDREGGYKYLHVDDLEKIEGPPPEGPF